MRTGRWTWRALAGALVVTSAACGDDPTGPGDGPPPVGAVVVEATQVEMDIGATVQLSASVLDTTGVVLQGRPVSWSTSDSSVASVSTGGAVLALSGGHVTITATSGAGSGAVDLRVRGGPCSSITPAATTAPVSEDGAIDVTDCLFRPGYRADGWSLTLTDATVVVADASAGAFSPVIVITDDAFEIVALDAFSGDGGGARLTRELTTGTYTVWVSSWDEDGQGPYSFSLETREPVPCPPPLGTLTVGQDTTGTLADTSCLGIDGRLSELWTLEVADSGSVQIDLTSNAFDAMLYLLDGGGEVIGFNDDYMGLDSRIVASLAAGTYTIRVTTFGPGQSGDYRLSTEQAQGAAAAVGRAVGGAAVPATPPWRIKGRRGGT